MQFASVLSHSYSPYLFILFSNHFCFVGFQTHIGHWARISFDLPCFSCYLSSISSTWIPKLTLLLIFLLSLNAFQFRCHLTAWHKIKRDSKKKERKMWKKKSMLSDTMELLGKSLIYLFLSFVVVSMNFSGHLRPDNLGQDKGFVTLACVVNKWWMRKLP